MMAVFWIRSAMIWLFRARIWIRIVNKDPDSAVFRIHDISVWIWIRGSLPLTNGSGFASGCGSGSCYFRHWQDANKKLEHWDPEAMKMAKMNTLFQCRWSGFVFFGKPDPDPQQSEKQDPDPQQSEKQDPHQSQNSRAAEAQNKNGPV
jgi:hypothetical protein